MNSKTLTCLMVVFFLFTACQSINKYFGIPNDNQIEACIEKIIENQTGIKIDLTPEELDYPK